MIQRIQTLWLLLVSVCGILLCCMPAMCFSAELEAEIQSLYEFRFAGMWDMLSEPSVQVMSVWPLAVLEVVIPLLSLVIIFLYRHRVVQARLCTINILLMVGYYASLAVYTWKACMKMTVDWHPTVWSSLFIVSIILSLMAIRGILHDEALVRAADRLR